MIDTGKVIIMFFKRFVAMLLAVSMLMPQVAFADPFAKASASYRALFSKYVTPDFVRGVYVDKSATIDNWCLRDTWVNPETGKLCRDGTERPLYKFVIPQAIYSTAGGGGSSSATMRAHSKKAPVTNTQLAAVASAAADAMSAPGAFTRMGLAFDARGRPADVFTPEAVTCDALGWVLKTSCETLALTTKKERQTAYCISELLNKQVVAQTGHTLVALNDDYGRDAVAAALRDAARYFAKS